MLKEVLLKFNNLKYTSGSPNFNFFRLCSPNPLRNIFRQWSCILNSLAIKSRSSISLYMPWSLAFAAALIASVVEGILLLLGQLSCPYIVCVIFCRYCKHLYKSNQVLLRQTSVMKTFCY